MKGEKNAFNTFNENERERLRGSSLPGVSLSITKPFVSKKVFDFVHKSL